MRGLAALVVFISHYISPLPIVSQWGYPKTLALSLPGGDSAVSQSIRWLFSYTPLKALWLGHSAVILFFVLSGFVLALPYMEGKASDYPRYLVRRWFRLYIPYIVSLCIAALLMEGFATRTGISGLSHWFNMHWRNSLTLEMAWDHIFMLGKTAMDINGPVWTLVHEMRISVIFPFMALFVRRTGWVPSLALAGVLYTMGMLKPGWEDASGICDFMDTVRYSSFFIIGAVMARYRWSLQKNADALPIQMKVLVLFVGLVLYSNIFTGNISSTLKDWAPAIGSTLLISLAVCWKRLRTELEGDGLVWVGSISYSLYLTHSTVLQTLFYSRADTLPLLAVPLVAAPIAIVTAWLFHRAVEKPSISIGRWITRSPNPSPNQPPHPPPQPSQQHADDGAKAVKTIASIHVESEA